jgi:glucosylceramidase
MTTSFSRPASVVLSPGFSEGRLVILFVLLVGLLLPISGNATTADVKDVPAMGEKVSVWVTSSDQCLSESQTNWHPQKAGESETIAIDTNKHYQSIVGFGGAFTDAACCVISRLPETQRAELLSDLLDKKKMDLSLCRMCIGSSDYSREVFSYDEGAPDPKLERFSIDHDREYVLPVLKQALAVNADLFLFGSPWSPPGWMKSTGTMLGGNIRRSSLPAYAEYIARFLKAYRSEGVNIEAVTVQNEVDTDQDGRMPACIWPQEIEVDFVRQNLGPLLSKENIKCQIWMIDHNYNLWGRALASLEGSDVRKYASAIAWHGYLGDAAKMTTVHDAYPNIDAYWTEGGPDYTDPNYARDWVKWSKTFTANLRNWCRGITVWNLALDEQGKPNIGPFPCGGLVTVNSKTGAVSYSGQYRALSHYSRFISRNAVRVDSRGEFPDVSHVAFQNPDGKIVSVLTNGGAARKISIEHNAKVADLSLPPNSVTTVVFN